MTTKKKNDEDSTASNQQNPSTGEEPEFQTPQVEKSGLMTYMRNPDRVKNKRGNNLTPIDHTPTPRGDKHLGVDHRGDHVKKKNQFEIRLREPSVSNSRVELEGGEHNDQQIEEEEVIPHESSEEEEEEVNNEKEGEEESDEDEEEEANDEDGVQNKGKEIVVATTLPRAKPVKEKKPRKEPAPNGLHIPTGKDLMLPQKKNRCPWGEAPYKSSILFGYTNSWAAKVCATRDHARAKKLLKRQRDGYWPIGEECGDVRTLVEASGLGPGIEHNQSEYDSVIVSAFKERFWPETDTFHLPFGEMTIIPDDVKQILNLEVEGKCLYEDLDNNMSWNDLYSLVEETLGWGRDETDMEFMFAGGYDPSEPNKVNKVKKLLLNNLRKKFVDTLKKQDKGELLKDLNKTRDYSWGTATLAYILQSLIKASRVGATEIAWNVALLMAWVYEQFPSLRPPTEWG
ncbi:uncharacterized protein LOC113279914 [Papaver somniferum]|uniref:uncharacterized protein LOC113279914 n=1 Tax=Papaver somniferum TaxID=3469 RepID=UPI000E6FEEEF|nr:uncharacterized protein LOC113279914 [Papaver somniferum]